MNPAVPCLLKCLQPAVCTLLSPSTSQKGPGQETLVEQSPETFLFITRQEESPVLPVEVRGPHGTGPHGSELKP